MPDPIKSPYSPTNAFLELSEVNKPIKIISVDFFRFGTCHTNLMIVLSQNTEEKTMTLKARTRNEHTGTKNRLNDYGPHEATEERYKALTEICEDLISQIKTDLSKVLPGSTFKIREQEFPRNSSLEEILKIIKESDMFDVKTLPKT